MADLKDLQFLPREKLLMQLAVRQERERGRIEIIKLILQIVDENRDGRPPPPKEIERAAAVLPAMEQDYLELISTIHWLTRERD